MLPRLLRDVIDFCYPCICAHCKNPCDTDELLCEGCLDTLVALEQRPACDGCGAPLAVQGAPCPYCNGKGIRGYQRILRLATFDEPLKGLIHRMKYQQQWMLADRLADRLLVRDRVKALLEDAEVLVPVPLHFLRQVSRGYNQAALLARRAARASGKPVVQPLKRVRRTDSQTQMQSRKRRFENLRGAFRLTNPKVIAGKRVLVIDDVMTTGATLKEIARTLRPARPAGLAALVLAVADPKHRGFRSV